MKYLLVALLLFCLFGCDNAYLNPDVSKAVTERKQYDQLVEQNKTYERIAVALEKIAERMK